MATAPDFKVVKQTIVEGINLLAQGKRNLLCSEIHQAVNQFEEAARIFSQEYGELADECASVYYLYGHALLELHRSETNIFEDETHSESDAEDEDEENDEKADDAASQNSEEGNESEDLVDEEELGSSSDLKNFPNNDLRDSCNDVNNQDKNGKAEEVPSSTEVLDTEKSPDKINEDISNLQLSWETLELAKIIYMRQNTPKAKLKLADTFFKLGDVGLEMEQFKDAIKDYEMCLEMKQSCLPEDNRQVAETLYQLGVANTLNKDYKVALDYFRGAIRVMELRKKRLKKVADGEIPPDANESTDGFYTPLELAVKEIEELSALVKEVHTKIEEVEDEQKNAPKVSLLLKESITPTKIISNSLATIHMEQPCFDNAKPSKSLEGSSQIIPVPETVNNITHLIRKKKVNRDDTEPARKIQKLSTNEPNSAQDKPTVL